MTYPNNWVYHLRTKQADMCSKIFSQETSRIRVGSETIHDMFSYVCNRTELVFHKCTTIKAWKDGTIRLACGQFILMWVFGRVRSPFFLALSGSLLKSQVNLKNSCIHPVYGKINTWLMPKVEWLDRHNIMLQPAKLALIISKLRLHLSTTVLLVSEPRDLQHKVLFVSEWTFLGRHC